MVAGQQRTRSLGDTNNAARSGRAQGSKRFPDGPPQGKSAPSGGSDPRSGGAWGQNTHPAARFTINRLAPMAINTPPNTRFCATRARAVDSQRWAREASAA